MKYKYRIMSDTSSNSKSQIMSQLNQIQEQAKISYNGNVNNTNQILNQALRMQHQINRLPESDKEELMQEVNKINTKEFLTEIKRQKAQDYLADITDASDTIKKTTEIGSDIYRSKNEQFNALGTLYEQQDEALKTIKNAKKDYGFFRTIAGWFGFDTEQVEVLVKRIEMINNKINFMNTIDDNLDIANLDISGKTAEHGIKNVNEVFASENQDKQFTQKEINNTALVFEGKKNDTRKIIEKAEIDYKQAINSDTDTKTKTTIQELYKVFKKQSEKAQKILNNAKTSNMSADYIVLDAFNTNVTPPNYEGIKKDGLKLAINGASQAFKESQSKPEEKELIEVMNKNDATQVSEPATNQQNKTLVQTTALEQ